MESMKERYDKVSQNQEEIIGEIGSPAGSAKVALAIDEGRLDREGLILPCSRCSKLVLLKWGTTSLGYGKTGRQMCESCRIARAKSQEARKKLADEFAVPIRKIDKFSGISSMSIRENSIILGVRCGCQGPKGSESECKKVFFTDIIKDPTKMYYLSRPRSKTQFSEQVTVEKSSPGKFKVGGEEVSEESLIDFIRVETGAGPEEAKEIASRAKKEKVEIHSHYSPVEEDEVRQHLCVCK